MVAVPVMVGKGFTVIVIFFEQPSLLVYIISTFPAAIPVTNPELLTVATEVLEDVHALVVAADAEPVN
jgi:hypothetical protein